jgi:hypothetical protein
MLGQLRNYKYATLPEYQKFIQRIWANIPEHEVRAVCDAFDKRLRLVIKAINFFLISNMHIKKKIKIILIASLRKKVMKLLFWILFRLSPCI